MVVSEAETVVDYDNLTEELPPSSPPLPPPKPEQEASSRESTFAPLSKQNSILSLTLDEIQCRSGMRFGSMSMDEFLASIWCSDDDKVNSQDDDSAQIKNVVKEPTISSQASFSLPPPICKKTVDEVWSEIHEDHQPQQNEANNLTKNETLKKEQTFGEMTLEDFLIKAGVIQKSSLPFKSSSPQPKPDLPLQNQTRNIAMGLGFSAQQNAGSCVRSNGLAEAYSVFLQSSGSVVGDPTSGGTVQKCQGFTETSGVSGRKRIIDGPPEVVVERRQRRMLKNRESAARSRARRQAYTVELEAELNHLREENEELKQMLVENERKRKQEIGQRKLLTRAQIMVQKFRAMRRTTSAAW